MKFNSPGFSIVFSTFLLFICLLGLAFAVINTWYWLIILMTALVIVQLIGYYRKQNQLSRELQQFAEAIQYRDFSRNFNPGKKRGEPSAHRQSFQLISETIRSISKESETRFLHLQSILEIVDTGIFSYETTTGEVLWMNESLKKMWNIPYLKSIDALQRRNPILGAEIRQLMPGQKTVTPMELDGNSVKVMLSATVFKLEQGQYKLIALQNIHQALDEGEAAAWQKLLNVMTHEIMNSVAPIASLSDTLHQRVRQADTGAERPTDLLPDLDTGLTTIRKRSEGLMKFTDTYRSLSKIKQINLKRIKVVELFDHIEQLLRPTLEKRQVYLNVVFKDPLLSLQGDATLLEQVLINLVLNSLDALQDRERPTITLEAEKIKEKIVLRVTDNGTGIAPEVLEKIFIPFFTTKKTGSGIGLSLCKQVMVLHKGTLSVQSEPENGSVFSLIFEDQ